MLTLGGHDMLDKEDVAEVLPRILAVLAESPDDVKALGDAGHCYNVLEQEDLAMPYFEKAAKSRNPYAWLNYAAMLRQCDRHEEAKLYVWNAHRAMPADKKAGHIYAEELIREGQWLKAWPLCARYRYTKQEVAIPGVEEWTGQDIRGKRLAIVNEGGRGDAFWLFRFLPKVREMGAHVSFLGPLDVAEFLEGHPYLGPVDEPNGPPFDYWVSVFELLEQLQVEKAYWPGPYMGADPILSDQFAKALATFTEPLSWKVGLCWDCGELVDVRKYRSLKREQAAQLLSVKGIEWVSLQKDQEPPIPCLIPELRTWHDTAAVIKNLDLVITMDTAVAHLAGAMQKPTWLVLGGFQDCKWMTGETTEWYPSMRIFRNKGFGFQEVLSQVILAVECDRDVVTEPCPAKGRLELEELGNGRQVPPLSRTV